MITILLYTFYLLFFYFVFRTYSFTSNTGFSFKLWFAVFLLKFLAGCANLYFHKHAFLANDLFFYYQQAMEELQAGRSNPWEFVRTWLFDWEHMKGHLNFFQKENMVYWSTLGTLVHTKLMTLFTILTLGSEYLNILFYNFLFFLGQLAFYKTLYSYFPQKKWVLLLTVFFIPSVLFWCSGIHKDGLVFSLSGAIIYCTHHYLAKKQLRFLLQMIVFLALLLCIRYFYFLCILPPLLILLIFHSRKKLNWIFLGAYLVLGIAFFSVKFILPINPLQLIINKQEEYFKAQGYSDMETPLLQDNVQSFLQNLPVALDHAFLRPYPDPTSKLKYFFHGLDVWFVMAMMLLSLFYFKRNNWSPIHIFIVFYTLSVLLFIGYTIPNCGAVVRYRSGFIGMLLPVLLLTSNIPWIAWYEKWTVRSGNRKLSTEK